MTTHQATAISDGKRKAVYIVLMFTLLLAGSVFAADWMNYAYANGSLYPAIAKPCITLLAFVLVLMAGRHRLERRDWLWLLLAFLCMLPTDILMSLVVVSPALGVGGWVFMLGGVLSIIAHVFLIIRVGRGLHYLKKIKLKELWLPLVIYGTGALLIVLLWPNLVKVGHAVIGPIYSAFFCTTMWFAWETVRRKLYPAPNAWMAALAATCWFATEILGEIYNLQMGGISAITFCLVWVFYGTNVVLWALSGYRWHAAEKKTH